MQIKFSQFRFSWLRGLSALLLLTRALAYGAEGLSPDPETDDDKQDTVYIPPVPEKEKETAASSAVMIEEHRQQEDMVARKLRQAELLYELDKYAECMALCEDILLLDAANDDASELKVKASKAESSHVDKTLEAERAKRDHAAMNEVTRMGMVPERGLDIPRPSGTEGLPFQRNAQDIAAADKALEAIIPEINLVDTDLSYVIQLLFKTHDINIIYPSDILADKKVTIQARNIRLSDILTYLSRTHGLHYTVRNGIVWLYSEEDTSGALFKPEVIALNTGLNVAAGQSSESGGGGAGKMANDIETMLEWMAENWPGWPEGTKWMLDYKTNSLVISSAPNIIDDVRQMVSLLDVPPIQVLISSVFVEIGESDLDQLGLNWSVTGNPQNAPDPDEGYRNHPNKITIKDSSINTGVAANALQIALTGVLSKHQFDVTLNALTSQGSTKVLTAPRVIAINNHFGKINLTRTYRYPTNYETVTTGIASDNSNNTATTIVPSSWQNMALGFELRVRPSVGRDMRTISMEVFPTITDLQEFSEETIVVTDSNGGSTPYTIKQPIFSTNEVEAVAVVEDGSTIVIGGLFRDNIGNQEKGVPVLSKLPGVGKLFKTKDRSRERSCLLIFVTARIITPGNQHYTDEPVMEAKIDEETLNRWLGDPSANISR